MKGTLNEYLSFILRIMNFDDYLKSVYGFTTKSKKYKNMPPYLKRDLRESFKMDMQASNRKSLKIKKA